MSIGMPLKARPDAVVANQDVGFVEVGQPAEIKIDTFPFTRYGLIHGRVERISRDAVEEPQSEQQRRQGSQSTSDEPANVERAHQLVYTARIALEEKGLVIDGKPFELAPGMSVVAEIKPAGAAFSTICSRRCTAIATMCSASGDTPKRAPARWRGVILLNPKSG
jgi:Cation efflux system protein CusB domain 1